ncbi:hypothetical protein [Oceanirhabdus sp. W0125-5]|uniref:hypothetical protein n=1 Tax=Oceanirhabdus sp. W0125-5 TaxID=2999116 RepID=UPI0022F341AD|nr:hypothetical protein [Oceanirhabdus sp. W0125-5]WBW94978.1 hypothetical protein OW730_14885 [Oceanirhabdus sp. W0125-5]
MKVNEKKLIDTLLKFQEGYSNRDITKIDEFISELFIDSEEVLIIGTAYDEWCKGLKQLKELLYIDWFYWGNFKLDIDNAHIYCTDKFATVSTTGILQKEFQEEKVIKHTLGKIEDVLKSECNEKEKLLKSLKSISYYLHEENIGDDVKRRVRFSAVLNKEEDAWKFVSIHFSYPVAPPTDVKLI